MSITQSMGSPEANQPLAVEDQAPAHGAPGDPAPSGDPTTREQLAAAAATEVVDLFMASWDRAFPRSPCDPAVRLMFTMAATDTIGRHMAMVPGRALGVDLVVPGAEAWTDAWPLRPETLPPDDEGLLCVAYYDRPMPDTAYVAWADRLRSLALREAAASPESAASRPLFAWLRLPHASTAPADAEDVHAVREEQPAERAAALERIAAP